IVATFCVSALLRSKVVTSIVGISAPVDATRVPGGTPGGRRAVGPRPGGGARSCCCRCLRPMRVSCSGSPRSMSRRRRMLGSKGMVSMPSRGLAFAVAAITVLVFAPVLGGTFLNWDDDRSLLTNQGFRGVDPTHLRWMFTTTLLGHYAPLTWLSFGVTYAVAGMAPAAYHAGSVLLHALNAVLVYLLAARLIALARPTVTDGARLAGATVAALAFAVHPLRAESVGWITDRGDVLCATFYLTAVVTYVRFALSDDGGGGRRRGGGPPA